MTFDVIPRNLLGVFQTIDDCIEGHRVLPALILLYATIDIVASLQRREGEGIRQSFERWANDYILPTRRLRCSAVDLYAARCGILHTLTAEADLVRKGEARRIIYAWGSAEAARLQEASRRLGRDEIALHVSDLRSAVAEAVATFLEGSEDDVAGANAARKAVAFWFTDLSSNRIEEFLERTGPDSVS